MFTDFLSLCEGKLVSALAGELLVCLPCDIFGRVVLDSAPVCYEDYLPPYTRVMRATE